MVDRKRPEASQSCGRCGDKIHWNGQTWTTTDAPIEPCLPGLGYDHEPAVPRCPTISPTDQWPCDLPDTSRAHTQKHAKGTGRAFHEHRHAMGVTNWEAGAVETARWNR